MAWAFLGAGIYAKAFHTGNGMGMFYGSLAAQMVFALFSIKELRRSAQLSQNEKSTWTGLLLVAPVLSGMVYLISLRRKLLNY